MIRELAGYDNDRARAILRWPIREGLIAYRERVRELALEDWRHAMLVWAIRTQWVAKGKRPRPPAKPAILGRGAHGG